MARRLICLLTGAAASVALALGGADATTSSAPAWPSLSPAARSAATAGEPLLLLRMRSPAAIGLARLVSARLGLVAVSAPAPPGTIARARLLATTSSGRGFTEIGPKLPRYVRIEDVRFLDRWHGWLVGWSAANVGVTVYRTSDGGRSWQSAGATHHSQGAGAVATVQFLSPRRGWLVNQEPTAPAARLFATSDGGASWQSVGPLLPEIAPVVFASPSEAWQAGGLFSRYLFHSRNGGRSWARVRLPLPVRERAAVAVYGQPAFFGREVLAPVTFLRRGRVDLAVYRSVDDGRSWRLASLLAAAGATPQGGCRIFDALRAPLPVSLASGSSWWVGVYEAGSWFVYRTVNGGRSWQRRLIAQPRRPPSCPLLAELQAIDNRTAWFTFLDGQRTELYTTRDAALHWRRLRPS